jgi:hypothetical protein
MKNRSHTRLYSMKHILFVAMMLVSCNIMAQDFSKSVTEARTAYASGKLDDARAALQQSLNEIDLLVAKEVTKLLPEKLDALNHNAQEENISTTTGIVGVSIHRMYGTPDKSATLDIIGNSPLTSSINAMLSLPFIGNSGDGSQKVIRVNGYKSILQKNIDENNKVNYTLQIPVNSTLITLEALNSTETEIVKYANLLPLADIARMLQ